MPETGMLPACLKIYSIVSSKSYLYVIDRRHSYCAVLPPVNCHSYTPATVIIVYEPACAEPQRRPFLFACLQLFPVNDELTKYK